MTDALSLCYWCWNMTTDCFDAMDKDRKYGKTQYLKCRNFKSSHIVHCAACVNYLDKECALKIYPKNHFPVNIASTCPNYVESRVKCGMCNYFQYDKDARCGESGGHLGFCNVNALGEDEMILDISATRCATHGAVRETPYREYQTDLSAWCGNHRRHNQK